MEEPQRLVCPHCDLVYRLKKVTPGRAYTCKACGTSLARADGETVEALAGSSRTGISDPAVSPEAPSTASSSAQRSGNDLARLPSLIEQLTRHLDAIKGIDASGDGSSPALKLMDMTRRLEENLRDINFDFNRRLQELDDKVGSVLESTLRETAENIDARFDAFDGRVFGVIEEKLSAPLEGQLQALAGGLERLDAKVAAVADKAGAPVEALAALHDDVRKSQLSLVDSLENHRESQMQEIHKLLAPVREDAANTTVEVDIDELADRLVAGVRGHGQLMDAESGSAVDAMARLADELVKEQSANTARLDKLAEEIRNATVGISKLEEWRGELPERVADEIGQTVEARVVGPISGALARQAPSILSELQDSKLVDIVSRSVREAQRPLLREILAGGRNGVPVWLFASVLLPLLLILGYLFLPGEISGYSSGGSAEVADAIARMETSGVPLTPDMEDRLHSIEEAVLDLHQQALGHAKNAAGLEEEVKNMRRRLEERDKMIAEYTATLEKQTRRLQAYEMRLVQLGVSPNAVAGQ